MDRTDLDLPSDASDPDDRDTLIDSVVDKYRVVRLIGRGGMGSVYEGLNTRIQKRVALKFIDPSVAKNPDMVERFHREALAAGSIDSQHIVQIFDAGVREDGSPYIVMEYLPGCDLGHQLSVAGPLALGPTLHLGVQVLRALQRAHDSGIVHRDLKPDNVFLVDREGQEATVKLLDFGVSKIISREGVPVKTLTQEGAVVGTPYYMSPEQAQAASDVDHRTDIYSVGAILYECLTGRPPQGGRSYEQVIVNICTRDVEDVRERATDVPESLALVIGRALARKRDERFESATDFLDALVDATPDDLRDKYLAPLLALEELGLRPVSTPSSPERRGSGASRRSASDKQARSTPVWGDEAGADEFAETIRADSGERAVSPSTLPSPDQTFVLGGKAGTRVGLAVAVAALAVALVIGIVGRDDQEGSTAPATAGSDVVEARSQPTTTEEAASGMAGSPGAVPTAGTATAGGASASTSTASSKPDPSPPSRTARTGEPVQAKPTPSPPLARPPKPAGTPTLSLWR